MLFRTRCAALRIMKEVLPETVVTVVVGYAWGALATPGGVPVDNRFPPAYYYYPSGSVDDTMATPTVSGPAAEATAGELASLRCAESLRLPGRGWPGEVAGILRGDISAAWERRKRRQLQLSGFSC